MTEIVVVSGKGGTGKTSLVASFAALAKEPVLADCDVDASDLHLVLAPKVLRREVFRSGRVAVIRREDCISCGACMTDCRFGAVSEEPDGSFKVDPLACEGCGVCAHFCPVKAVDLQDREGGEWLLSETRVGPMVHARLGIAAGNSGKLVSLVRHEARRVAGERGLETVLTDGPPGIGCPVIASVVGASLIVAVAEATRSGEHDLERVLGLARHFSVPTAVCVNKWDLNPEIAERIGERAGASFLGRIPYDRAVTEAQVNGRSVVEGPAGAASKHIREIWEKLCGMDF